MCPGCGHDLNETTDHTLRDQWEAVSVTCHACRHVAQAGKVDDDANTDVSGTLRWAERRET